MRASIFVALAAALVPAVHANIFITEPVSSTTCQAGQPCNIKWKDDSKTPTLAEIGDVFVTLCTGGAQQQTVLQDLGATNAATTGAIQFVPNGSVGEDSSEYFIKMVSVNMADPANPQYKTSAYSAKFTLKGMTGKFNSTIQSQIAGTPASSTGTLPAGTSTSADTTTAKISTTHTSTSSTATGTPANSNNAATNGAGSIVVGMGMFGATVLAAFAAVL
ncbi:Ser-Thr-rich glycosyl-phosphatidyl-inositol-anchored membrane family [Rhizoctonia solani]|uniref:Ser-Thr-rich glycosyl-phosphatidyl-inositol-anchored membrane family n=1 Tax=Rhizoctonia solani TaxID=456999 RepID=A0A8H7HFB4_9AGAM|nr:Ser-Thr-rich glycosyl-phosphatidyl-inositol-anchored membrane family [Rhizoctonia solani]